MSSNRTSRIRLAAAATAVLFGSFALTACQDGTGVKDEGASSVSSESSDPSADTSAPSAKNDSSGSASGSGSDPKSGSEGAKSAGGQSKSAGNTTPQSAAKAVTCEGSTTKTVAAPLKRPLNHMLLTVTNTGSRTCSLYGYPAVRFGEAQSVPPVIEDSQPQAVVTLRPGQSGYAAIALSSADGSAEGRTEKNLTVYFQGRSGNESVGKGANPPLPAEGVYVDDSLKVTYWQQSMDDAVNW